MVEIFVTAYLILSLLATLLIWMVLIASNKFDSDTKTVKKKRFERNQFHEPQTQPGRINI